MKAIIVDGGQATDIALERGVLGSLVDVELFRARTADGVPDAAWASADAVLTWGMALGADLASKLARCRIVVGYGVGTDHIDAEALGRAGIAVCNVPDYGTGEVADHALALMLSLRRGLPTFTEMLAADPVAGWRWNAGPLMRRLDGDTLGIVGYVRIGRLVARRARRFGLGIAWFDPHI